VTPRLRLGRYDEGAGDPEIGCPKAKGKGGNHSPGQIHTPARDERGGGAGYREGGRGAPVLIWETPRGGGGTLLLPATIYFACPPKFCVFRPLARDPKK